MLWLIASILIVWFLFCLPSKLFVSPTSTVLTDCNGELLSAQIASDGQWRFPYNEQIPDKFEKCILHFEDKYFYYHLGINPVSIVRAIYQNISEKRIVSGGSTITTQVIRLSRKGKNRTYFEKLIETILAFRLELSYSKKEILALYSCNAPFGGNIVGLEAAAWRYYSRPAETLSWGEAATLAVLPNAPSLVYPGKNSSILKTKRNKLLDKLYKNNVIDFTTCKLAKSEPLPGFPKPLPQIAPHLLTRIIKSENEGTIVKSTLKKDLQIQVNSIVDRYYRILSQNEVKNIAILVLETNSGNVISYVGNVNSTEKNIGDKVDIITAPRSTGSLLKPFLYSLALKEGIILPKTLLQDIPIQIAGYRPQNFDKDFDGAVPADKALARSLNIPSVLLLKDYGLERFRYQINQLQLNQINKAADYYGLTLILGGAESCLWDLCSAYADLGRILIHYKETNAYYKSDFRKAQFIAKENPNSIASANDLFSASSIWFTFKALSDKDRPLEGDEWDLYKSAQKIAWKTGTSFGFRDAWSIGVTPNYVVGVWVGNADGEGRPGLTGSNTASPIMFDVFKHLKSSKWFEMPDNDLERETICQNSGYIANQYCTDTKVEYVPKQNKEKKVCPYHKLVNLDETETYLVNSDCYKVSEMHTKSWFILPSIIDWFYKSKNPNYKSLPYSAPNCISSSIRNIGIIYPTENSDIFIPYDFNHEKQKVLFEATHLRANTKLYWYIDRVFIGETQLIHQIEIDVSAGSHTLSITDEFGESVERNFKVIE